MWLLKKLCHTVKHMVSTRKRLQRRGRWERLISHTSMLHDDGKAAFGCLGIFMIVKVPGSLPVVSCNPTKPTKMITVQENNFWRL